MRRVSENLKSMKNNSFIWMLLAVSELLGAAALAQISETPPASANRFSLNSRIGYNISATFSTTVSIPSVSNPGPPVGSGIDRTYDDGYVRLDASGNRDGLTWNWGYVGSSQTPGNDTLLMSGYASQGSAFTSHADGDPQLGLDLSYARVLGNHSGVQWGLEAALGWTDLTIDDNSCSLAAFGPHNGRLLLGGNYSAITSVQRHIYWSGCAHWRCSDQPRNNNHSRGSGHSARGACVRMFMVFA